MNDETAVCLNCASEPPAEWVCKYAPQISGEGRVLDLACGLGRHARWLAGQGYRVLAADRDEAALAGLSRVAAIDVACVDLESGIWPFGDEAFAGIVVTRYLHRPLLPRLAEALSPGGVLIYETFMLGNEVYGRPSRPEFLLLPGELESFARQAGLEILARREGFIIQPRPAMMQAICARRPA